MIPTRTNHHLLHSSPQLIYSSCDKSNYPPIGGGGERRKSVWKDSLIVSRVNLPQSASFYIRARGWLWNSANKSVNETTQKQVHTSFVVIEEFQYLVIIGFFLIIKWNYRSNGDYLYLSSYRRHVANPVSTLSLVTNPPHYYIYSSTCEWTSHFIQHSSCEVIFTTGTSVSLKCFKQDLALNVLIRRWFWLLSRTKNLPWKVSTDSRIFFASSLWLGSP